MNAEGSYRLRALGGGALSFAGFATSQGLTFLIYVALARLVSPKEFGVYSAGALVTGVGMLLSESGMLAALITRGDRIEEAASTAVVWNIVSGLGLMIGSLVVAPIVGILFDSRSVAEVSAALSGVLPVRALGIVPDALLQRRLSFARRVIIEPLGVVLFGIVAIALTAGGAGVWGLVAGTYAAMVARTALSWAFVRWRPHFHLASVVTWRELIRFARPVFVAETIRHFAAQVDVFIVGRFLGLAPLGQYRYATRIAGLPHSIWVSTGAYVLLPIFARLAPNPQRLRSACIEVTRGMAAGVCPASLLLVALGLPGALLAFGPEWRQAGYAIMTLAGFPLGQALISVASEAYKATGHPEELPKVHLVSAIATPAFVAAMLPLGVAGVGAGVSGAALVAAAFTVRRMRIVLDLPTHAVLGAVLPALTCAVGMGVSGYAVNALLMHPERHGTLVGLGILGLEAVALLGLYAVALMIISPSSRRDAIEGARVVRRRLRERIA